LAIPELKNTFINIINEDLLKLVPKIGIPTLIIWGEDDQEVPLAFGQKMHFQIPNSIFYILKEAGHFSFLDKPEEFVGELRGFLSDDSTLPG
jgi:pimeloyl-ACP methyl ester carboxylesterase